MHMNWELVTKSWKNQMKCMVCCSEGVLLKIWIHFCPVKILPICCTWVISSVSCVPVLRSKLSLDHVCIIIESCSLQLLLEISLIEALTISQNVVFCNSACFCVVCYPIYLHAVHSTCAIWTSQGMDKMTYQWGVTQWPPGDPSSLMNHYSRIWICQCVCELSMRWLSPVHYILIHTCFLSDQVEVAARLIENTSFAQCILSLPHCCFSL